MIRTFLILAVLMMPALGNAQALRIQSGQHSNFTRLVIYNEDFETWSLGRVDGGYELRIESDEPDLAYAVGPIFDLISRKQIAAAEDRGGGHLYLSVECECHASAFRIPEGLVVDIKDGPAREGSVFELALDISEPEPEPDVPTPVLPVEEAYRPNIDLDSLTERYRAPRTRHAWAENLSYEIKPRMAVANYEMAADAGDEAAMGDRVEELEQDLIDQLARAAAEGFVIANIDETESMAAPPAISDDSEQMDTTETMVDGTPIEETDHIKIETAIDRARPNPDPTAPTTVEGARCFPDSWFALRDWGVQADAGEGFFLGRTTIVGEFDEIDTKALEELAKKYIYLTFGLEAKALLSAFDSEVRNNAIYLALADIMDHGHSESRAIPVSQVECDAPVAMWSVLANTEIPSQSDIAVRAVLAAFEALPIHLRRHLGPTLATRFIAHGDTETATLISNSLKRSPDPLSSNFEMLEAELALASGDRKEGVEILERVFREDGPLAADAAVRLVDESIDHEIPLPLNMPIATAAMAHEARGTETGSELLRVQIRSSAAEGDVLGAEALIRSSIEDESLELDHARALRREIYAGAIDTATDEVFIELALSGPPDLGEGASSQEIAIRFAERLLEIGLPPLAREFLNAASDVPTDEMRLNYAQSYLSEMDGEMALAYLGGLRSESSLEIRAHALELIGNTEGAAAVYAELDDGDAALNLQWQSQDWESVAELAQGALSDAAQLALPDEEIETEDGVLARNRRLLAASEDSRAILGTMLESLSEP